MTTKTSRTCRKQIPALEVFREGRIALGYLTKTGPAERNGAYKWSRLCSLLERRTALSLFLFLSFSLPFRFSISFLYLSSSRSFLWIGDHPSSFDRRRRIGRPPTFSTQEFLTSSSYQVPETGPPSVSLRWPRSHANHRSRRWEELPLMPIYHHRILRSPLCQYLLVCTSTLIRVNWGYFFSHVEIVLCFPQKYIELLLNVIVSIFRILILILNLISCRKQIFSFLTKNK